MDYRVELEKRLEKQRSYLAGIHSQIADLRVKADTAEAVIKELEALQKILPRAENQNNGSSPKTVFTMRQGSEVWQAREALREFGKATHTDKILEKMNKPVTKENRRSLASQLGWHAKRERFFTKTEPYIFGLLEWDSQKGAESNNLEDANVESK
jgi:hypothetical protein